MIGGIYMKKDLIIFADYGLDDAAATFSVFRHRARFGQIYVVPIGGNVPASVALQNAKRLLALLPCGNVTLVDTTAIPQPSEYLKEIHGQDGMGDLFPPLCGQTKAPTISFEAWLARLSGQEVTLSLGPMTMVLPVLKQHPTCALILMGGCVHQTPNFGDYEFNHALDPAAFAKCVAFPHVAITLDTCRTPKLDIRPLKIEGDGWHAQILRADQRLSQTRGEDGCYVWDDVAACYLLFPDRFVLNKQTDPHGNQLTVAEYISPLSYFATDAPAL